MAKQKGTPVEKILCMFSGGLDSLTMLYLLLTDERYRPYVIHVHHMVLKNIENRALAEKVACQNIIEYFRSRNYRAFEYSESLFDYSFMNQRYYIFDTAIYGFLGANMMINDPSIIMMANGRSKDDIEADHKDYTRTNMGLDVYHAVLPQNIRYQRPYILPVGHLTRQQMWEILPEDLRILAWSCRKPVYENNRITECGQCTACLKNKKIRSLTG